ncbi:uncharacterized protein LOC106174392 isoform X2 [Lingula anatina]|uniref:Uncharacterized protein LOC106174392 isoform X2 n=1 Tax=Lingula anatina TaxID=7574 RepID=A0A2R2MRB3_LINAN|nr:uncharacterized protein LOC106174392 isoform X2 [Lingula anatina]|eukprot:XP_023932786.1 uncharacterized protein LOC106174392 isoform X2 [Lingula anatina]
MKEESMETTKHDDSEDSMENKTDDKLPLNHRTNMCESPAEETEYQKAGSIHLHKNSSKEKFDLLGLLSPAIPLYPHMNGTDSISQQFEQLSGKDKNLILVAAHVDDALRGRGAYGKARAIFKLKWQRRCFAIIDSKWFNRVMYAFILLHTALVFFEPTQAHVKPGQVHWVVFVLELLCLFMYTIDIALHLHYFTFKTFWTWSIEETKWTRVEFIFLLMFVIDFVILVLQHFMPHLHWVQPFRCLRLAAILCKSKNVSHIFDVCLSIIYKLGKVFFIIFIFIGIFSAVGVHVFSQSYHCLSTNSSISSNDSNSNGSRCVEDASNVYTGAFDNIGIAALRLFVLLTTENYPDLMVPAYDKQHANFIYFGIYLYVGVFFLTAILLAIVVESYWAVAKTHVKRERKREREELVKAWNILDPLGEGEIDVNDERIFTIFQMLRPKDSEEEIRELIEYVDHDQNNVIDVFNWTTKLTEALQVQFDQDANDSLQLQEKTCASKMSAKVKQFIDSTIFTRTILILIVVHSILFCIKWHGMKETDELIVQALKTCIISIFFVEILLKLIGIGKQLKQPLEFLDIILSVVAILTNALWYFVPSVFQEVDPMTYKGAMVVTSCLAVFCRLGLNSRQTRKAVLIIMKIHPVMFDLIVMVVIIMFFYAVLGLEIFFGQTDSSGASVQHYEYDCGLGFESLWNSMVCSLLHTFQLVTTSNWHDMMNDAMKSTNDWASLYFVSAFVVINLVVMNLFVAITIEAFNKLGAVEEPSDSEQGPEAETQEKFSETAKKFFTSILASSRDDREDPTVQVVSHGAAGGGRRMSIPALSRHSLSHTSLAGSNVRLTEVMASPPSQSLRDELEESEEDDYTGLTSTEIKERKMKKRMQRRRRQETKIKVISAYRKKDDSQLDLHMGDEVTILEKSGDFVKGTARGKTGWFPAHCVKELVKGAKRARRRLAAATATVEPTGSLTLTQGQTLAWGAVSPAAETVARTENIPGSQTMPASLQKVNSSPGMLSHLNRADSFKNKGTTRIKRQQAGDWRRQIHGDMTVMNQDELFDLQRMSKAKLQRKKDTPGWSGNSPSPNSTLTTTLTSSISPLPEPDVEANLMPPRSNVPQLSDKDQTEQSSEITIMPELNEEEEEEESEETLGKLNVNAENEETGGKDSLSVEVPRIPSKYKKKVEQNKKGEMPEWAKKFISTNNIEVTEDSVLEEAEIPDAMSDQETPEIDLSILTKTVGEPLSGSSPSLASRSSSRDRSQEADRSHDSDNQSDYLHHRADIKEGTLTNHSEVRDDASSNGSLRFDTSIERMNNESAIFDQNGDFDEFNGGEKSETGKMWASPTIGSQNFESIESQVEPYSISQDISLQPPTENQRLEEEEEEFNSGVSSLSLHSMDRIGSELPTHDSGTLPNVETVEISTSNLQEEEGLDQSTSKTKKSRKRDRAAVISKLRRQDKENSHLP